MLFKILLVGEHTNHDYGDSYGIDPLTSSVSLLSDGETNVIFDTGSLGYRDQILGGLESLGLSPLDIHHVLLTHDHLDHTCNVSLFENAEVHISRSLTDLKSGAAKIYADIDAKPMPLGVKILPTPGHTKDHCSYLFEIDGVRYCIGGDAVREDTIRNGVPHFYDEDRSAEFVSSMKAIFDSADVILPGHFRLIEGSLKEELGKLVSEL